MAKKAAAKTKKSSNKSTAGSKKTTSSKKNSSPSTKKASASLPAPFFISQVIKAAWKQYQSSWIVPSVLMGLLFLSGLGVLFGAASDQFLIFIAGCLVTLLMYVFGLAGLIKYSSGNDVDINELFGSLKYSFYFLGTFILYILIVLGGLILFIVPGLIWSIKYIFAIILAIDEGMTPVTALKKSAAMTDGLKWDLAGFWAVISIVGSTGVVALIPAAIIMGAIALITQGDPTALALMGVGFNVIYLLALFVSYTVAVVAYMKLYLKLKTRLT